MWDDVQLSGWLPCSHVRMHRLKNSKWCEHLREISDKCGEIYGNAELVHKIFGKIVGKLESRNSYFLRHFGETKNTSKEVQKNNLEKLTSQSRFSKFWKIYKEA